MKNLETFNEYSSFDHSKDEIRINAMVAKAKDDDHLLRLATTMAKRITKGEKAYHRAEAAEDQNYHDVAKIFYDRAKELGYITESLNNHRDRKEMIELLSTSSDFDKSELKNMSNDELFELWDSLEMDNWLDELENEND